MFRLDPHDRKERRAVHHPQRLHAQLPDDVLAVDADGRRQIGHLVSTEEPQILPALPRPRDLGGRGCRPGRRAGAGGQEEGWKEPDTTHSLQMKMNDEWWILNWE